VAAWDTLGLTASTSVAARLPGTVFQELLSPAEIFAPSDRWSVMVGAASGDLALSILPELQRYWFEVERLSPSQAMRHLEDLSAAQETSVDFFGARVETQTLGFVAPAILLVLLLHLMIHVNHLTRLHTAEGEPQGGYTWSPLYGDWLARAAAWISLVFLPAAALGLLAYRLTYSLPLMAAGVGVVALCVLALGFWVIHSLDAVRQGT
jgi:hypothetical protein